MRSRCSLLVLRLLFACAVLAVGAAGDAPTTPRRLFYIGLALYSEQWSQNDVVELADTLSGTAAYQVVPMIASNVIAKPGRYPIADDRTIEALARETASQIGPDDLVFIGISTHGAPQVLARKIGDDEVTELPARRLSRLLAPLVERPTVLVISACYSGSLIADLRAPRRIIITAGRADRSSFGCAPDSRHTLFGEAELRAFQPHRSLHQIYAAIRDDVARMERESDYTPPSRPQVSVGAQMIELYEAPLF
jgi:Peptidase C13 family